MPTSSSEDIGPKFSMQNSVQKRLNTLFPDASSYALIRTSLALVGNTPFDSMVDMMELYKRGGLEVPGIASQAVRQFFGAKNEIDATRVLAPSNLVKLSERYNYDVNKVLQDVHKVTDRRGIDPLVRKFVDELKKQKGGK